jgi:hypothetical protein
MKQSARLARLIWGAAFALTALAFARPAPACGGFFSRSALEFHRRPSLAHEQALIVFDAETRREHFIREIVFRSAEEPFGFVVPTPSRPEVAAVTTSPFESLRTSFPFRVAPRVTGARAGAKGGGLGGALAGAVHVLEVTKVGSFTAFVLAADDKQALVDWLTKNGFSTTPQSEAWLAHYVQLKFYYVAMRYDLPNKAPGGASPESRTKSETMRISFQTPLPYYPYLEPDAAPNQVRTDPRLLELWLVSQEAFVPVAAYERPDGVSWVRPLAAGLAYDEDNREVLSQALGSEAGDLPAVSPWWKKKAPIRVQTFMDQKRSRAGFGDILFVPSRKYSPHGKVRDQLLALLPVLDRRLLGSK